MKKRLHEEKLANASTFHEAVSEGVILLRESSHHIHLTNYTKFLQWNPLRKTLSSFRCVFPVYFFGDGVETRKRLFAGTLVLAILSLIVPANDLFPEEFVAIDPFAAEDSYESQDLESYSVMKSLTFAINFHASSPIFRGKKFDFPVLPDCQKAPALQESILLRL